jgi:hypothetical protein
MKTEKAGVDAIAKAVEVLNALKEQFKDANHGIPYDPPKPTKVSSSR